MDWRRPLTGVERWMWMFHQAAPLNVVMAARLERVPDADTLRAALTTLCERHPTLHARIDDGRPPRFVALPLDAPPPVFEVVSAEPGDWRNVVTKEMNHRFPGDQPMLRAHLLVGGATSDLILCCNHSLVDGHSGGVIVDELLRIYAGEKLPPAPRDAPASGFDRGLGSLWRGWATALRMMRLVKDLEPLPVDGLAPPAARRTHLRNTTLNIDDTAALVDACRDRGVTAQAAIVAAVVLAAADEIRAADGDNKTPVVGCGSPIDLRRHYGLDDSRVGNLVSGVNTRHEIGEKTDFWDLAGGAFTQLRTAIEDRDTATLARFQQSSAGLVSASRVEKMIVQGESKGRAAVVVTNLGRLDTPDRYGDVRMTRLSLAVSAHTVGGALLVGVVTAAGRMSLTFTYAEPQISEARATRMTEATTERLLAAVRG